MASWQTSVSTAAFPAAWWGLIAAGAIPGFLLVELDKYLRRSRVNRAPVAT